MSSQRTGGWGLRRSDARLAAGCARCLFLGRWRGGRTEIGGCTHHTRAREAQDGGCVSSSGQSANALGPSPKERYASRLCADCAPVRAERGCILLLSELRFVERETKGLCHSVPRRVAEHEKGSGAGLWRTRRKRRKRSNRAWCRSMVRMQTGPSPTTGSAERDGWGGKGNGGTDRQIP
jgi:hypothetical protein